MYQSPIASFRMSIAVARYQNVSVFVVVLSRCPISHGPQLRKTSSRDLYDQNTSTAGSKMMLCRSIITGHIRCSTSSLSTGLLCSLIVSSRNIRRQLLINRLCYFCMRCSKCKLHRLCVFKCHKPDKLLLS